LRHPMPRARRERMLAALGEFIEHLGHPLAEPARRATVSARAACRPLSLLATQQSLKWRIDQDEMRETVSEAHAIRQRDHHANVVPYQHNRLGDLQMLSHERIDVCGNPCSSTIVRAPAPVLT